MKKNEFLEAGLTAIQHRSAIRIDRDNIRYIEDISDYGRMVGIGLSVMIFGVEEDSVSVTYPANWWEAFKERWLPTMIRFGILGPVKRTAVTMSKGALYPSIPAASNGQHMPVPYLKKQ